jgi:hypothetical protein
MNDAFRATKLVETAMHYRRIGLFAASLAFATTSFANYAPNIEQISKNNLRADLEFIASDLLLGRDTPSQGLDLAAAYIISQLKINGVMPGGENGSYLQPINLERALLSPEGTVFQIDGKDIELGSGFMPNGLEPADVQGTTVFVKSGWTNLEKGIDPMKGMSLKGAIILTDGSLPEGVNARDAFRDPKWESPAVAAKRNGAVAVITIAANANPAFWKRQLERMTEGGRYTQVDPNEQESLPSIQVSPEVGDTLKTMAINAARAEFTAPGPMVTLKLNVKKDKAVANNVIGIIPGSDPVLKNEYVALGAHYDHVGVGRADATGDTIYNGADDDGSGTVAMLEISRVIAKNTPPKRSTVFVWHCGEEKGLWGSQYFASHPTIDFKKLIIQVNMDMIAMAKKPGDTNPANADLTDSKSIYVIGPKLISSDITKTLTAVNNATVKMNLLDTYDTTTDPNSYYTRSDHYSYIQKGVPAIFLFSGSHENYHRPSDEIKNIDFDKLTLTTKLLYGLAYEFAMQPEHPKVDGPLKSLFGGLQ